MYLKRYFIEGLAHASYLFGDDGEAAVVDPKRDVDDYLADAERLGMKIVAILNTHPHADFASGFRELAERTGALVYISHRAPVSYPCVTVTNGFPIQIGTLELEVLSTPGHTPDSVSYLVRERSDPKVVFTGDTLFVNDVGRPDLGDAQADARSLAGKLHDSLFKRLLSLPDEVKVYATHGLGSLSGRAVSPVASSLIGQERQLNWALQIRDREEFVQGILAQMPARPAYYSYVYGVNLVGARPFSELPSLQALSEAEVVAAEANGATVVDTRPAPAFVAGHLPGSLNVDLNSPLFSTWVGFIVSRDQPIVLIVGSASDALQARLELARLGLDQVLGYLEADALTVLEPAAPGNALDPHHGSKGAAAPALAGPTKSASEGAKPVAPPPLGTAQSIRSSPETGGSLAEGGFRPALPHRR